MLPNMQSLTVLTLLSLRASPLKTPFCVVKELTTHVVSGLLLVVRQTCYPCKHHCFTFVLNNIALSPQVSASWRSAHPTLCYRVHRFLFSSVIRTKNFSLNARLGRGFYRILIYIPFPHFTLILYHENLPCQPFKELFLYAILACGAG